MEERTTIKKTQSPPITGKTTSILCPARTLLSLVHREAVYMALVRSCMRSHDGFVMPYDIIIVVGVGCLCP